MSARFLTIADVAEQLSLSVAAVRVMVRSGELPAIQVGGKRQWRVEANVLEDYICKQYQHTQDRIKAGALD